MRTGEQRLGNTLHYYLAQMNKWRSFSIAALQIWNLSVYQFVCLRVNLSVCLHVCLSICLFLSLYLFVCLPATLSVCVSSPLSQKVLSAAKTDSLTIVTSARFDANESKVSVIPITTPRPPGEEWGYYYMIPQTSATLQAPIGRINSRSLLHSCSLLLGEK